MDVMLCPETGDAYCVSFLGKTCMGNPDQLHGRTHVFKMERDAGTWIDLGYGILFTNEAAQKAR